jgi:hypothetical protein
MVWTDEAGLDAAQRRLDEWESSIAARAARTRALSGRLAELTGTAHSEDRTVEATVDSSGALVDIRLDERTRGQSAARTAALVLMTTRAAYAELLRKVAAAAEETLGPDDPSGRAIVDSYGRRFGGLEQEGNGPRAGR